MLSSSRRASARRLFHLALAAALTVTVRLPFLLRADRFFDSDEAVEGLMARHVLKGELPVFLWGQQYKGVPEVYVAAGVFSVAGPGVIALKAATLAVFVAFVCLQFTLADRLFSRRVAWIATAFVLVGPPSLVLWTLSANAEVVWTLGAGAVLCLAIAEWRRTGSRPALALAGAAVGFGLWVHQYIVYYLVALALAAVAERADRARLRAWLGGDGLPGWVRISTAIAGAVAVAYVALGAIAFMQGGFDLGVGGVPIGIHNPQKLWRIGAALLLLAAAVRAGIRALEPHARTRRIAVLAAVVGFVAGYAPALFAAFGSRLRAPMGRMDIGDLSQASGPILTSVAPIVFGFRAPSTEWLPVSPWLGLVLAGVVAVSFAALRSQAITRVFHILLVVVPALFIASGSFVDAQSYRYVMPIYGALPVVLAIGIDAIGRRSTPISIAVLVAALGVFGLQQVFWYMRLAPDARSAATVECLDQHAVRAAFGDYWLSYKVTFLTDERVIVAPYKFGDRYPPFTTYAHSMGVSAETEPCRSLLLE